jgi:hypothetical protein
MVAWFIGDLTNVKSCHGHNIHTLFIEELQLGLEM